MQRLMSVTAVPVVAVLAAVSVLGAPAASGGTTAPAAAVPAPDCVVPDDAALRASSPETPEGWRSYETWAAGPQGRAAVTAVATVLAATFGEDTKYDATVTLRHGLVGTTLDHVNRQIVVVVDPASVDTEMLARTLRDAVAAAGSPTSVRVSGACRSASALVSAADVIQARAWSPDAATATFGFALEPRDSAFHVTFAPGSGNAAATLASRLGDAVVVAFGNASRRDRMNDGNPHYGGAAIGGYNIRFCSAGFVMNISGVGRGGSTAGHCFSNGAIVYSGTHLWGTAGGKYDYPRYDMMRISSSSQTYANKIHVDPCCPSVRTVTGKANPVVGEYLCVSGYVTLAKCGLRVTTNSAQLCDADGCTTGLMRAVKPGEVVGQGGDSGAPVYIRPTTTTATIKAMEVGGTTPDEVLAELVGSVESHLSATVATS